VRDVRVAAAVLVALLAACGGESHEPGEEGEGCERTSDCEAPLVCRLELCRVECEDTEDCAPGLSCVLDSEGRGSCQVSDELRCVFDSDCPDPLVCSDGACTNECTEDRDCPPGGTCAEIEGELVCVDAICVRDSECPAPLVCGFAGRCEPECVADMDCPSDRTCIDMRCFAPE